MSLNTHCVLLYLTHTETTETGREERVGERGIEVPKGESEREGGRDREERATRRV